MGVAQRITMYGIRNCDTIKKARGWLDARGVVYAFHDYATAGVDPQRLAQWVEEHGWQTVLNRAGTTFRRVAAVDREGLDIERAQGLMVAQPSMIKRPILDLGDRRIIGFTPASYEAALSGRR